MSPKLLLILMLVNIEASMFRSNGLSLRFQTTNVLSSNGAKLGVIGNMMTVTCADDRTLVWLPNTFTTLNIINHLKFSNCFYNKSNLINYTDHNNNEFNLNQFIVKYTLNVNAHQLTLELNEMSEINVDRFFENFKFNSFKELNFINVNYLNQTLLGLLDAVTKLKLVNNYQINLNYFKNENSLEFLTVRENIVKSFNLERFKNLLSLEVVDCDVNFNEFNIRNFFNRNHRLFSIIMERNFKSNDRIELSENLFNGLNKLKSLKFAGENLFDLPAGIFRDLASLIQLNLAHNRLEYLPKEIFYDNQLLESIDVSYNNLKEITDEHFSKTPYLMVISLNNNSLETIQYNASLQSSIQIMDLSNNRIQFNNTTVCPIITSPGQYIRINLAYNKIEHIKSIECLISDHSVQLLNVSGNQLTEFNIFRLAEDKVKHKMMSQLILSNNRISQVDLFNTLDWDSYAPVAAFSNIIVEMDDNPVLCNNCTMLKNILNQQFFILDYKDVKIRFMHPHYCKTKAYCDVETYHQFVYQCPAGCNCTYNEFALNFRVNCSNSNLTEVPQIPYPSFLFTEVELILDNNSIERFTLDNQYYDVSIKIAKISIRNNMLKEFTLPYDKYPLHLVELDLAQNTIKPFSNETLTLLNIAGTRLNVTLGANQFCDNKTYYEYFTKSYQFNVVDDLRCYNKVEALVIAPFKAHKMTISNLAIVMITAISIIAVLGVIGVVLLLKTKRKVIFLRSKFINHKRLNEGSADLAEELLGQDEI